MQAAEALSAIVTKYSGTKLKHGWSIKCPSHADSNNSASVDLKDNCLLIRCHAGCSQEQVVGALKDRDLWPEKTALRTEYYYHDLNGKAIHRKVRIDPPEGKKTFVQEHFNGTEEWHSGGYSGELLPYDFMSWKSLEGFVFLVEGEKCAEILKSKGLIGTTTGGASSWASCYARHFKGRTIIIIPDNDSEGKNYSAKAYDDIVKVAGACKIMSLPELGEKQDIYDWFRSGHSRDELLALAKNTIEKSIIPFTFFKDLKPVASGGSLIAGLLDRNNQSCLYGESNVGKSMIAIDMSIHIARGENWFGRSVTKGSVMYIAAEAGPSIAQRTEALKIHHELKDESIPFAAILNSIDMFDKAADTSRIIEGILALERQTGSKCELVVIDTLSKAIAGANENAAQDMNSFLFNVERIRSQTMAHVMIVHHSGKDLQRGARGHSSLRAAMDTEIEVFAGGLRVKKQRSMQILADPLGFKLCEVKIGEDSDGVPMTSCVVEERSFENNSSRLKKSSERALQAMECLRFLITNEPRAPQVKTKSPMGVKVMTHKRWKELFMDRHMLGVESRSSRDSAFKRAAEELQAQRVVGVDGEFCWFISRSENDLKDEE